MSKCGIILIISSLLSLQTTIIYVYEWDHTDEVMQPFYNCEMEIVLWPYKAFYFYNFVYISWSYIFWKDQEKL